MKKIYTFKNGATLIYKHRRKCNATAFFVGFQCGQRYEQNGLPHLLEHILNKGTTNLSQDEIVKEKSKMLYFNAMTSNYVLMLVSYDSNRRIDKNFKLAQDMIFNSSLPQDLIKNEAKVILEEREKVKVDTKHTISDMTDIFIRDAYDNLEDYLDKWFGTPEFLLNVNSEQLLEFKKKHFVANKFLSCVVSSMPFYKVKRIIKNMFVSKLEERQMPIIKYKASSIVANDDVFVVDCEDNVLSCLVTIAQPVEDCEKYRFDFNLSSLERIITRKNDLIYKVRNQGLAYIQKVSVLNDYAGNLIFHYYFKTSSIENIDKILKIFGEAVSNLKRDGISQEELDFYRENWLAVHDLTKASISLKDNAEALVENYQVYGKHSPYDKRKFKDDKKDLFKVTTSSLKQTIDGLLNKENKMFLTVEGRVKKEDLRPIEEYKNMVFNEK